MLGLKLVHKVKSLKNLVYAIEAKVSVGISCILVRMFVLIKSCKSSTLVMLGQKLGHCINLGKTLCTRYGGHIFRPICMKLGQNVFLNETLDEFENWSCGVKN